MAAITVITSPRGRCGARGSEASLAAAQRPDTLVVAPEGPLPFATGAFDLVHALFVMHFKVPTSMTRELRPCAAPAGLFVANCYGDGVEPYREQMRGAGWDLTESRPVTGVAGHVVDLWRQAGSTYPS